MTTTISVSELQKMSAGAIRALPDTVMVKDGATEVAFLVPLRRPSREQVAAVMAEIDAAAASRTPEETAALKAVLGEEVD